MRVLVIALGASIACFNPVAADHNIPNQCHVHKPNGADPSPRKLRDCLLSELVNSQRILIPYEEQPANIGAMRSDRDFRVKEGRRLGANLCPQGYGPDDMVLGKSDATGHFLVCKWGNPPAF